MFDMINTDIQRRFVTAVDQAYSDILTPWYTDRYTTHDPMVEANEWTLAYLKQIGYHDNLNEGEK